MKKLSIVIVILLLLGCFSGCGSAKPAYDAEAAAARVQLEDFTVQLTDGTSCTLSKLLEGRQLGLINVFAVESGASTAELPALAEAYSKYQDRVAVLALSDSLDNSPEMLAEYAEYFRLPFPVASAEGLSLLQYVELCPVSILIDSQRNILAIETEGKSSADAVGQMLDRYLSKDFRLDQCTYTVIFYDADNSEQIPGCTAEFTLGDQVSTVTSGENGVAVFTGAPAGYHVEAISAPDGYKIIAYSVFDTAPYDSVHYVALEKTAP